MSDKTENSPVGDNLADAKKVGDAARQAAAQAREAGADAVNQAKDVASEAKDRASSLAGDVKETVASAAETQKGKLADRVDSLAHSIHRSGTQLEGEQDWIAKLVERGAAELGSLADTLRTNDLQSLVGNLDGLARRQPALFLGASVVAGFALSRVGKVAVSGTLPAESSNAGPPSLHAPSQTPSPATPPAAPLPRTGPTALGEPTTSIPSKPAVTP